MHLRSILLTCAASVVLAASAQAQTILAKWTFDAVSSIATSTTVSIGAADSGALTSGTLATGVHASASTSWTNPSGNGSIKSVSSNNWAVGDYYQFTAKTTGYQSITVSWDQVSSSTGPGNFGLFYSTNGSTFTQFGSNYAVLANTTPNNWTNLVNVSTTTATFVMSSIQAIDNLATVYFRVQDMNTLTPSGGTVASGGTSRIDNFTVTAASAVVVPEPSTYAALLGAAGLVGVVLHRRRRSGVSA